MSSLFQTLDVRVVNSHSRCNICDILIHCYRIHNIHVKNAAGKISSAEFLGISHIHRTMFEINCRKAICKELLSYAVPIAVVL
jgi:hypothetical protein